ncbi:MAG: hypothetical protein GEV08_08255 [Acidimicrobiia bacterium]|nr:hypothetical protein [Acidimicrobiia bacterium]
MIALGLLILVAAVVVGAVGVLGNDAGADALSQPFEVLGVEFTGSAGRLFLYGILVGIAGTVGIGMMLAGSRRRVRHRFENRRERKGIQGEAETLQQERDRMARELEDEREKQRRGGVISVADSDRGVLVPPSGTQPGRPAAPATPPPGAQPAQQGQPAWDAPPPSQPPPSQPPTPQAQPSQAQPGQPLTNRPTPTQQPSPTEAPVQAGASDDRSGRNDSFGRPRS